MQFRQKFLGDRSFGETIRQSGSCQFRVALGFLLLALHMMHLCAPAYSFILTPSFPTCLTFILNPVILLSLKMHLFYVFTFFSASDFVNIKQARSNQLEDNKPSEIVLYDSGYMSTSKYKAPYGVNYASFKIWRP